MQLDSQDQRNNDKWMQFWDALKRKYEVDMIQFLENQMTKDKKEMANAVRIK